MTQKEIEKKLKAKILEAFALVKEYDPNSQELYMSILKNTYCSYHIMAHNDAYKREVKPILLHSFSGSDELKFKEAEIDLDDLFCTEAVLYAYDKAAAEVNKAANEVGDERQTQLIKVTLSTQRAALKEKLFKENRQ